MNFLFKSKFDISTILLYVIGFWGCLFIGIYFSFIKNYDTDPYDQIVFTLLSIILAWFAFANLKEILRIKYIVFYRDRFRIKTFLGLISRDYFYEEIESWLEEEKENKYSKWTELILILKNEKRIYLYSSFYKDFWKIKQKLTQNKKINEAVKYKRELYSSIKRACFLLSASIILFSLAHFLREDQFPLTPKDTIEIKGTLSKEIQTQRGKRDKITSFYLRLEEYPYFRFFLSRNILEKNGMNGLLEDFQSGDKVRFLISKKDYETKIIKTKYSFALFPYSVDITEIEKNNSKYLSLSEYNGENSHDYTNTILYIAAAISAMFGIFEIVYIRVLLKENKIK
jgi:lipoprotein